MVKLLWLLWSGDERVKVWDEINSCVNPQQLGRSWKVFGHLPRNLLEPHQPSAPEPSGPHQLSAPEPSGTLSAICTGALPNPPGPHPLSAPEPQPHQPSELESSGTSSPGPSGTSSAICPETLRNLISHLHRNPPEPSGTFSGTWCCSCTGSPQSYSGLKTP